MVPIGPPYNVLGGAKHTRNVVYGHPELKKHRCARMSEDMRSNLGP